jgi:hypothetical protein
VGLKVGKDVEGNFEGDEVGSLLVGNVGAVVGISE